MDPLRELLQQIAGGDQKSFYSLFELYKNRVYNTALSYLQNKSDAEEITQDVFVEIYESAASFEGNSAVGTWIYRIAVNKCLDKIRYLKRKKRFALITSIFATGTVSIKHDNPHFEHPGATLQQKELSTTLFLAINKLPEQQKTAFILAFVEDLPRQEVADIMGVSLKSIESLLQRAKANLRKELSDFYNEMKE